MRATARAIRATSQPRRARLRSSVISLGMMTALAVPFAGSASALQQPGPPSGDGVVPQVFLGAPGPDCDEVFPGIDTEEIKHDFPEGETPDDVTIVLDGGPGRIQVDVEDSDQGQVFDFTFLETDSVALGVIVKGGNNSNFYDYSNAGNAADTFLHAPVNENNENNDTFFDLSNITFCIVDGYTPPTSRT